MLQIPVKTNNKTELVDITSHVQESVSESNIKEGIVVIQSTHTTAGITINENADPDVKTDILKALEIFNRDDYKHSEGNSDAHVKTSLMGSSATVIIKDNKLQLGIWQSIFLAEFDGPRNRKILIELIPKI